jgi:hypothetical protein
MSFLKESGFVRVWWRLSIETSYHTRKLSIRLRFSGGKTQKILDKIYHIVVHGSANLIGKEVRIWKWACKIPPTCADA